MRQRAAQLCIVLAGAVGCSGGDEPKTQEELISADFVQFLGEVFDRTEPDTVAELCRQFDNDPWFSHRSFTSEFGGAPIAQINLDDYSAFMHLYCP